MCVFSAAAAASSSSSSNDQSGSWEKGDGVPLYQIINLNNNTVFALTVCRSMLGGRIATEPTEPLYHHHVSSARSSSIYLQIYARALVRDGLHNLETAITTAMRCSAFGATS